MGLKLVFSVLLSLGLSAAYAQSWVNAFSQNYYERLGLHDTATCAEVEMAHRRLHFELQDRVGRLSQSMEDLLHAAELSKIIGRIDEAKMVLRETHKLITNSAALCAENELAREKENFEDLVRTEADLQKHYFKTMQSSHAQAKAGDLKMDFLYELRNQDGRDETISPMRALHKVAANFIATDTEFSDYGKHRILHWLFTSPMSVSPAEKKPTILEMCLRSHFEFIDADWILDHIVQPRERDEFYSIIFSPVRKPNNTPEIVYHFLVRKIKEENVSVVDLEKFIKEFRVIYSTKNHYGRLPVSERPTPLVTFLRLAFSDVPNESFPPLKSSEQMIVLQKLRGKILAQSDEAIKIELERIVAMSSDLDFRQAATKLLQAWVTKHVVQADKRGQVLDYESHPVVTTLGIREGNVVRSCLAFFPPDHDAEVIPFRRNY